MAHLPRTTDSHSKYPNGSTQAKRQKFPTNIELGHDAERKVTGQLGVRPKIDRCGSEVAKEVIEKIEARLGDDFRIGRGIKAIIDQYKYPAGGKLIEDYSCTIEEES